MLKKATLIVLFLSLTSAFYSYYPQLSTISKIIYELGCDPKGVNESIFGNFIFLYHGSVGSRKTGYMSYSPKFEQVVKVEKP